MIASLRGQLIGKGKDSAVIEVNGVGFQVIVPRRLLSEWETPGMQVEVHTHLHVRENELALYGFSSEEGLRFFRLLLSVSGVGPKGCHFHSVGAGSGGVAASVRIGRCGGICPRARDRPKNCKEDYLRSERQVPCWWTWECCRSVRESAWENELIAALLGLGYNQSEARGAVASLPSEEMSFEERIRLALRHFAK